MKTKMFLLLSFLLTLVACEKDEFMERDLVPESQLGVPETRSSSSVPDPITQLDGIPVHIRSIGTGRYLSSEASGSNVVLSDVDDGSLRQRWNMVYGDLVIGSGMKISLIGGNSSFNNPMLVSGTFNGNYRPFLVSYAPATGIGISNSEDPLYYYINVKEHNGPIGFIPKMMFVQPESINSNQIKVDDNYYKGTMTMWEVIPVEEFEILDMKYQLTTGDDLVVVPQFLNSMTVSNDTDEPVVKVITIQNTVTNESNFSQTEKLSIAIKNGGSVKVGIPKFVEGSFDSSTTSSQEWSFSFGNKETVTKTMSETVTQTIPARTTITVRLYASEYKASLTYVVKLKGLSTKKIIYLKGKWNGVVVQDSEMNFYYPDGTLLRSVKSRSK